jgi:signal transduction histidine kinase/ActR/RegA family two-component response regulator
VASANRAAIGSGGGQRPKWYLVYYILAVLDVITVLASLTLNYKIMQIYVNSVAMSQEWEKRETEYARLSELANAVNAPGNDVFDSRDVAAETARFHVAQVAYNAQFSAVRDEMAGSVSAVEAALLQDAFHDIQDAMQEMTGESRLIFGYFDTGQPERAGERMATMDRKYASVLRAFARLFSNVRTIRRTHFEQQVQAAEWLKRVEYLIMGLAILMIGGALVYGSRISRAARAAEAERSEHIAALGRARAEADDANRAKSSFLATVSHEIRTPLNSIFLTLEMLEEPGSNDERKACLAVARSSGRSLKRLIDELLDLSRIESGRIALESARFDLSALLHELLAPYVHRAAAKGVSLAIRIAPQVPPAVEGDPTRFGQIITNLVDNAVKFTAAGSVEVWVSVRPPLPHDGARRRGNIVPLRVAVRDTGIGVPPEQQDRIFEDFVQGDESTAAKYGGIGLGLGIVRRLVQLMKGELGVSSTLGGGSTFWFDLDLAASEGGLVPSPAHAVPRHWEEAMAGRRILLVEDVPESRTLTAAVLRQLGMKVDLAAGGADAVAAVRANRYDAILMDIGLPVMDGFEATRRIRERERGDTEVPIIALTAKVSQGICEQCLDAGMDDYLAKPVTRDSMVAALWRWLEPAPASAAAAHPAGVSPEDVQISGGAAS